MELLLKAIDWMRMEHNLKFQKANNFRKGLKYAKPNLETNSRSEIYILNVPRELFIDV